MSDQIKVFLQWLKQQILILHGVLLLHSWLNKLIDCLIDCDITKLLECDVMKGMF